MFHILLYISIIYFAQVFLTYYMDFLCIDVVESMKKNNNFNYYIKKHVIL